MVDSARLELGRGEEAVLSNARLTDALDQCSRK
jgi:hypothetical protein